MKNNTTLYIKYLVHELCKKIKYIDKQSIHRLLKRSSKHNTKKEIQYERKVNEILQPLLYHSSNISISKYLSIIKLFKQKDGFK